MRHTPAEDIMEVAGMAMATAATGIGELGATNGSISTNLTWQIRPIIRKHDNIS